MAETSLITLPRPFLITRIVLAKLFTYNQHSTTGGLWSRQFPPFLWTTDRFSPIDVQGQWHLIQELHVHVQYQTNIFTGIHKAHILWKLMQSVAAIFQQVDIFSRFAFSILDLNKPAGNLRHFRQLINYKGIFLDWHSFGHNVLDRISPTG